MHLLAEVSDKIVSPAELWAVMLVLTAIVAGLLRARCFWPALIVAALAMTVGAVFVASFFDDPIFGDAVLRENGWAWFASCFAATAMPILGVLGYAIACRTGRATRRLE